MKIIDLKSFIIGGMAVALVVLATGAGNSNQAGRYQITSFGNGSGGGAAYVLDTQTGEVWGSDSHADWFPKADHFWNPKD